MENQIVDAVVRGIQEKKGFDIVTADLRQIETAPAQWFVICSGNSPLQVDAVCDSVEETVRKEAGEKPAAVAGRENAQWVAMDYGTVMVHIMLPDAREFYELEELWAEAPQTQIENIN